MSRASRLATRPASGEPLPEGDEKRRAVRAMFDEIAPRYDLVNAVMTFGLDTRWRRRCVAALDLAPGALVLDVGCGTGDLLDVLRSDGAVPIGLDVSEGMLRSARRRRSPLVRADAASAPFASGAFDGAVSAFTLRNFADLSAVVAEAARLVRTGGRISLLDVSTPERRLVALGHRIWFTRAVPRIGRALARSNAYRYLPRSVAYLPPPAALVALVSDAGFSGVKRTCMAGGAVQLITGIRS